MLYDTSEMTIPTDNVDAEALVRPEHWDLPLIRRYMAMFGPLSSFSDFAIFAFLLYVVHAGAPVFRSAFFIESFVTQALVVFLLRTRRVPFFRSKPSAQLVATTLLCAAAGVVLPFTPLAHILGFASVPRAVLGAIAAVVLVYAAGVELAKIYFFRTHSGAPLPLALSSAMESR
jgi:Mg2+-importing ATPase